MSVANEPPASDGEQSFAFGSLRLFPNQRLLLEGDKPVRLGSRALDILTVLVEHAGRVVPKEELIARVWPNIFVDESNLKMQVSALRRAVGDGQGGVRYIVTVPGRGYEFVAAVRRREEHPVSTPPAAAKAVNHNLPIAVTRMIGRDETVAALISRLSRERLVTIVGPGGIGKTTLALAVAEAMLSTYEDGVWFIDLAPLTDPRRVPSTVAAALDLEASAADPLRSLVDSLRDNRMLLVLDNCEHVIESSAGLAAILLKNTPGISILATSREPLAVAGEREYRLGPLANPSPSTVLTAADARSFPAVQLFLERVSTVIDDFALTEADAALVVEICRRLGGLPLAIELAAARVEVLGIHGLAAQLDNSLQLLRARYRTTVPRHQTIRAVLDWSYGLLSEDEKLLFRRVGVFASTFDLKAAASIASDADLTPQDIVERLSDLVAKSLVTVYLDTPIPRFRLVETTRAYALQKLEASGERERLVRRGAEYARDRLEHAQPTLERRSTAALLVSYGYWIDNLRLCLDWAFSPEGDASVGVALTAAAVPLWMHLSRVEECRGRIEQALAALAGQAGSDLRLEMRLRAALGILLDITSGAAAPETGAAFARALEIAEQLESAEYQLRSLWGLWTYHMHSGHPRLALSLANRFGALAQSGSEPYDRLVGDTMVGVSHHWMGNQSDARRHSERMIEHHPTVDTRSDSVRFYFDQRVTAHIFLARILWLLGFPDQAMRAAHGSVEAARTANDAFTLCSALAQAACQIALWAGDLAAAEHYIEMLCDHSTTRGLAVWHVWGRLHQGALGIKRGDTSAGLLLLHSGLDGSSASVSVMRSLTFLPVTAEALGQAGRIADGLAAIREAIEVSERTDLRWRMADLLRIKGELLLLQDAPSARAEAESDFRQALDWARRQGALSWELRAATSLARLLRDQGRSADAVATLEPVYDRFTEGFGTADLSKANRLLDELKNVGAG